jgi:UDPglucose 6-dehydrogenase
MRVVIIGTGYVGLTTGVALAYTGHDVTCVDKNPRIVERLAKGEATIHEPGLEELLCLAAPKLTFRTALPELSGEAVVVIAVGTPSKENGDADMAYVDAAARDLAERVVPGASLVVVNKSTVPIGSARHVDGILRRSLGDRGVEATVHVASNPEFLAEGRAVRDSLYPDRIVIGAESDVAVAALRQLYRPLLEQTFEAPPSSPRPDRMPLPPLITSTPTSAELTKYAANSFLATKISFINEFAGLAEKVGADITQVARAIGLDDRIGPRFLHAGIGWGGSCFGKDTRAILATGASYDYEMQLVRAAVEVNQRQRTRVVEKLQDHLKVLRGTTIGLLGLAFKGDTDDLRDAPALTLIEQLRHRGAIVRAHDPISIPNARAHDPPLDVEYADDEVELARGCDAVVVVTDWRQYGALPLREMRGVMRGDLLLDARNLLDAGQVVLAGLTYAGVGR